MHFSHPSFQSFTTKKTQQRRQFLHRNRMLQSDAIAVCHNRSRSGREPKSRPFSAIFTAGFPTIFVLRVPSWRLKWVFSSSAFSEALQNVRSLIFQLLKKPDP